MTHKVQFLLSIVIIVTAFLVLLAGAFDLNIIGVIGCAIIVILTVVIASPAKNA